MANAATELDLARQIAAGAAPSPTPCGGFTLWSLRVTGTGAAMREQFGEVVVRDPGIWLRQETLDRLAGVPVLWGHTDQTSLGSDEYAARAVGNIQFAYISDERGIQNNSDPDTMGPCVFAICRVFDDHANETLLTQPTSTSPAVVFRPSDGNQVFDMGNGRHVLVEAEPSLIDHLAILPNGRGVWDRDQPVSGVRNDLSMERNMDDDSMMDNVENTNMEAPGATKEVMADEGSTDSGNGKEYAGQVLDKMLTHLDSIQKRLDALEKPAPQKPRDSSGREMPPPRARASAEEERQARNDQADAQMRWDGAYRSHSQVAPPPMMGEATLSYRARLARGLQRFAKEGFAAVELRDVPAGPAFDAIENRIYADAVAASISPELPDRGLVERTTVDPSTGARVTKFYGRHTFIHEMKRPARKVGGFRTKFD